uniref:RRM domain-containing protein n=1 Tax=Nothoprocta perdicaria TaxID=30464 RepID=A0A8C6YY64_NOTPE
GTAAAQQAAREAAAGRLLPPCEQTLRGRGAGPVIKVKIPKDRDGKPKQFAFVNFKHEESVPYGMSLLNGIKLFGRPLKIQFRSGSAAEPRAGTGRAAPQPPGPGLDPHSTEPRAGYDRSPDHMVAAGLMPVQRSPEHLQRQAMVCSSLALGV